jgi:hypothetical protein
MEARIFKNDAKQIVDLVFDAKVFREDLTRDNLNSIEEMIQFMMQGRFESYQRGQNLLKSIEANNKQKP